MSEVMILLIGTLVAASVGTITGFGVATVMLPIAALVMDIREALLFTALIHFASSFSRLWVFRKALARDLVLHFALPGILFAVLGAFIATELPLAILSRFIAVALFGYAFVGLFKPDIKGLPRKPITLWVGGALSGFSAGLAGMGGAVRTAVLASFNLPKGVYLAISGAIPVLIEVGRTGTYLAQGVRLEPPHLTLLPFLAVTAFSSVIVTQKFVRRIPEKPFRAIVFLALIIAALRFFFAA